MATMRTTIITALAAIFFTAGGGLHILTSHGQHPGTPLSISRLNMVDPTGLAAVLRLNITTPFPGAGFGGCQVFQGSSPGDSEDWGGICVRLADDPLMTPEFWFYRLSREGGDLSRQEMTWGESGLTVYRKSDALAGTLPEIVFQVTTEGVVRAAGFELLPPTRGVGK